MFRPWYDGNFLKLVVAIGDGRRTFVIFALVIKSAFLEAFQQKMELLFEKLADPTDCESVTRSGICRSLASAGALRNSGRLIFRPSLGCRDETQQGCGGQQDEPGAFPLSA